MNLTDSNSKLNISVIITCYNEAELLLNAVNSVKQQIDQDFELLIINDFSQDEKTNQICRDLESFQKIRVIWHQENKGLSGARNTGFEHMSGEIAVFLDADDTLPPNTISDTRKCFNLYPDAAFVYGDYIRITETSQERHVSLKVVTNDDNSINTSALLKRWIMIGTSPCKKSAWKQIGGYSMEFRNAINDMDFFMRMLASGYKGYYTESIIYNWYYRPGSITTNITIHQMYKFWTHNFDIVDRLGAKEMLRNLIVLYHIENFDFKNAKKFSIEFNSYLSTRTKLKVELLRFAGLYKIAKKIIFFLRKQFNSH